MREPPLLSSSQRGTPRHTPQTPSYPSHHLRNDGAMKAGAGDRGSPKTRNGFLEVRVMGDIPRARLKPQNNEVARFP